MKILAVSHEFPPIGGGGANACYFLTRGFVEAGHEVTLVTAGFEGLLPEETINGVRIIRVPAKRAHKEHCSFKEMLSYLSKAYPVAKELQKKDKFDVCLIFFAIPAGPIGYMLKKKYGLPYIIRFGGGDIPGFQERFTKVYKLLTVPIRAIWKNADKRIANSLGLKELAYEFCDKYSFDVIENGVDTSKYTPAEGAIEAASVTAASAPAASDKLRILFVSRLIERKGLQFVIPQLKNADFDYTLTIVGDGPYRAELERITRENGLEKKIIFAGQKEKDELVPYYQNADCFILPSAKEGMPNVVLEAMSCGLPIVMTPCQGSAELIDDSNGFVCDTGDFLSKLTILAKNNDLRNQMGHASREKVMKKFSWDGVVKRYLDIMSVYKNN